jgi:DNA repair and recombination protein RAD52
MVAHSVVKEEAGSGPLVRRAGRPFSGEDVVSVKRRREGGVEEDECRSALVKRKRCVPGGIASGTVGLRSKIQVEQLLCQPCSPFLMSTRPGGGSQIQYLAGHNAVALANHIFGYDGWESISLEDGSVGKDIQGQRVTVKWRTRVRVQLAEHLGAGGREDWGYGTATEGSEASAIEKAGKESVTDGVKRALMLFGEAFGCFKDKEWLKWAANVKRSSVGPSRQFSQEQCVQPYGPVPGRSEVKQVERPETTVVGLPRAALEENFGMSDSESWDE